MSPPVENPCQPTTLSPTFSRVWFRQLQDSALANIIRTTLNRNLHHLGQMTTVRIDTENHVLDISADLLGESTPVDASIQYRIDNDAGLLTFIPTGIQCSRPWLEALALQLLADNQIRIPLPPGIATTAAKILKL